MCGIFGYVGKDRDVAGLVLDGLKRLEYRGYDSWGVAVVTDEGINLTKQVGKIGDAQVNMPDSFLGFGHTRWATHGGVTDYNAHPHLDCTGRIAVIHNGIIENFSELRNKLLSQGHKLRSETDTEVVAHLLEEETKGLGSDPAGFADALRRVFMQLEGMNAVMALDSSSGVMVAAKNGSPLVLGYGEDGYYISSDASALLPHTRKVAFIADGQMLLITREGVSARDIQTGDPASLEVSQLEWSLEQAELGEYPHYLIKEIHEQPSILRSIAMTQGENASTLAEMMRASYGTFFIGCGTAANAALTGQYLFSRIARFHVNFAVGSEFGYLEHFLTPQSLVIALSQSGETIDVIEPLIKAKKEKGVRVAALVNVLGSTLYRMADFSVLLGAGPEKCVLATKSYTAKLAVLLMTAYALDGRLDEGKELVLRAADGVEELLRDGIRDKVEALAERIYDREHIFLIGRGLSYSSALEAALKIKEVTYIHAEGFAGGELKHGVIALIEQGTPCIVFAPSDETQAAILSGAQELKARGGFIIGISPKCSDVFDYWIPVADVGDASPIVNAVPAQLLAYCLSIKRGTDPDKPRNLAKSVTVK